MSKEKPPKLHSIRTDVLAILVKDLEQQSESLLGDPQARKGSLQVFETGIQKIIKHWKMLSLSSPDEGGPAVED